MRHRRRTWAHAAYFSMLLISCGPSEEELAQHAAEKEARETQDMQARALDNLVRIAGEFATCSPQELGTELLDHKWKDVASGVDYAEGTGASLPPAMAAALGPALENSRDLEEVRTRIEEGRALQPPALTEPRYDEPEYSGAWYISGSYRADYTGDSGFHEGVVITKGSRYFVVLGADSAGGHIRSLNGYVEDTGRTVTLNVGRTGREADVVRIADKETYNDDKAAHRAAVAEAKERYRSDLDQYRTATQDQKEAVEKLAVAMVALRDEEQKSLAERGEALAKTAIALHAATAGSPCP